MRGEVQQALVREVQLATRALDVDGEAAGVGVRGADGEGDAWGGAEEGRFGGEGDVGWGAEHDPAGGDGQPGLRGRGDRWK